MKKKLLAFLMVSGGILSAQMRYNEEVFSQVTVTSNVEFAQNIDFLTSDFSNQSQVVADLTEIQTALAMSQPIPAKFFDPANANTDVKVASLKMDIYEPTGDTISDRPVVIYVHTGNFLPPGINGSPNGSKTDSAAIVTCRKLARRGFVAVSVDYRLGWNPLANDPITGAIERRSTLLNAVYRAIHDVKQNVRTLKADAAGSNTYGIDPNKIVLYGEGSGGYVVLAYATLDKQSETQIPKFVFPGTQDSSYVQPGIVGDIDGFGGQLNLYQPNGQNADISFVVNAGGALADTSWLEAGDAPMVAVQTVRDPFAPFGEGTVIVPTTNEDVVDVQGSNVFIPKANRVGNNNSFNTFPFQDWTTASVRSHYGMTVQYIDPLQDSITIAGGATAEGLFPVLRPYKSSYFQNEGAPWQWWNPNSAAAQTVVSAGPPPVTAHMASLQSNPDMSSQKGRTYVDSILMYAVPRIMVSMQLNGYVQLSAEENDIASHLSTYPNPVTDNLHISVDDADVKLTGVVVLDITGKVVREVSLSDGQNGVSLADLKPGVYMVEIRTNRGSAVEKIVKQ